MRFQMAMVVSAWIKFYPDMNQWSLKFLELMMRGHWETSGVVSFYGARNTSCFQARCQGDQRLHRVDIHHLQVHMMTRGTTTTARVHLDLRRHITRLLSRLRRLRRLRSLRLRAKRGSALLRFRWVTDTDHDRSPSQKYRRLLPSDLMTGLLRKMP